MKNKLVVLLMFAAICAVLSQSCQNESQLTYARYYTNGKQLYDKHCQNCHNSDGMGLKALYPPLNDTAFLRKNRDKLACIIKHGLKDTITINGMTFTEPMPANHDLTDIDIAALITYITNTFGNKQGLYDVSSAGSHLKGCQDVDEHKQ